MKCDKCESERIIKFMAKVSDLCFVQMFNAEYNGYRPNGIGIDNTNNEDNIDFAYCLDCGKIQGDFPIEENPDFCM